jgi:hypothetical protein
MDTEAHRPRRLPVQYSDQAIATGPGELELTTDGEYGSLVASFRDADGAPHLELSTQLNERIPSIFMFNSDLEREPAIGLCPRDQETDPGANMEWDRGPIGGEGHMSVSPASAGQVEQAVLRLGVVGKGHELDLRHLSSRC